ncbi:MAG: MBL fold metallo-hydrolase [Candidatus Pacearchaeota archaeon]|nr:MBL fold metallo-hydrolase [Candidatus Pacearchaeota archaeon]
MEIGGVKIDWLGHAGFLISNGKKIAIDPYNISEEAAKTKADIILITHSHYDHCSIKDIAKLAKEGTMVIVPADAQSKITRINGVEMQVIEVGDELDFGSVKISTIPAYNIKKEFHPKNEGWFGYIVKMNNIIIYHAGDTDKINEMEKLSGYGKNGNVFIALVPVSGHYVMDVWEAVDAVLLIKPSLAIPMHYGSGVVGTKEDAEKFVKLCNEKGIKAEILERV